MNEQKKIGPFDLDQSKSFYFLQNKTTDGFSDGFSIRYVSNTCGNRNGWLSLGTVKESGIEEAKKTIFILFEVLQDEQEFIKKGKHIYRKNKSTVEIDVGRKRRVDSEWLPLINSYIDSLFEKENENLKEQVEEIERDNNGSDSI